MVELVEVCALVVVVELVEALRRPAIRGGFGARREGGHYMLI